MGKMAELKYVKELLSTDLAVEGELLIPKKIHDTLLEEVDKALIPRSEAAIYIGPGDMGSASSYDFDKEIVNTCKIREVGEGAEVPTDQSEYTSTNARPIKYGMAVRITRELLEDAKWNLLERNVRRAGKRLAENETNLVITALDGAANTQAQSGAAITIADITRAMQYVEDADYTPTTIFIGMEVLQDLRNIDTFVEANKVGNTEMLAKGFLGNIYGLNVIKFSTNAAPTTTYTKYAYVVDKDEAYAIVEKRTVSVENFELPLYDMSAAVITQRIAVVLLRSSAVCKITTA